MQSFENIQEIDLTKSVDSKGIVNEVIEALDSFSGKNLPVKLKLDNLEINQSQMIFIKSMVESYGHRLTFVQTTNDLTRDVCLEIGLNATNASYKDTLYNINNGSTDIFGSDFNLIKRPQDLEENQPKAETAPVENENPPETQTPPAQEQDIANKDDKTLNFEFGERKTLEPIKFQDIEPQKQTIGVYRKADEKENKLEFDEEENADFYAVPTDEPVSVDTNKTVYVHQTLRSGQILDYDGNVVIIGDCHPGSEIKATGDITVWGVLGSIAHAGAKGNREARIRALKMNAVQLRIANCYSRRPDGGNIPYIVKSSVFTPEEARIVDDNIVLFKLAQD